MHAWDDIIGEFRRAITVPRILVASFIGLILLGTAGLLLPGVTVSGKEPFGVIDSLFTATSAVCVTGLTVRDTGNDLSFFGQLIVLILIQLGGLGILTFSTFFLVSRTGRLGLAGRGLIEQTHGALPYIHPIGLLKHVFLYTAAIEGAGATVLTWRFAQDYPLPRALWLGVFTSISGFCNAGFSLFSDSLVGYQDDPVINLTMMGLIILGGLGFVVLADLTAFAKSPNWRQYRLSLHSRVVLITTACLIASGALFFCLIEMGGPNMGGSVYSTFIRGAFLSVTTRTAGFNTVDLAQLTNSSIMIIMILMVIGASPGSTGGGVKTTTAAALFSLLRSRMRSRPSTEVLDRALPDEVVGKALASLAGFLISAVVALILLEATETQLLPHGEVRGVFMAHVFEVLSALGTVGLSLGLTPELSPMGRLVITICMFLGRLGPVVVGSSFIGRRRPVPYSLPEESIIIG